MSGSFPPPYFSAFPPHFAEQQPVVASSFGTVPYQMVNLTYVPPTPSQISPNFGSQTKISPVKFTPLTMDQRKNLKTVMSNNVEEEKNSTKKVKTQEPAYKVVTPVPEIIEKVAEKPPESSKIVESKPTPLFATLKMQKPPVPVIKNDETERFTRIFNSNLPYTNRNNFSGYYCNLCDVKLSGAQRNFDEHCNGHRHSINKDKYERFAKQKMKEKDELAEKQKQSIAEYLKIEKEKELEQFEIVYEKIVDPKEVSNSLSSDVSEMKSKPSDEKKSQTISDSTAEAKLSELSKSSSTKLEKNSKASESSKKEISANSAHSKPSQSSSLGNSSKLAKHDKRRHVSMTKEKKNETNEGPFQLVAPAQKYFGCEICNLHGMPYSTDSIELHLKSNPHKHMKIFWENGIWPGDPKKVPKLKMKEPQIFKFLSRNGTLECILCNEAIADGTELLRHQQGAGHHAKLTLNCFLDKLPVIYICEFCNDVSILGRDNYFKHTASMPHQDRVERQSNEDCQYFYTSGCTKGNSCTFRHCLSALHSKEVCQTWASHGLCKRFVCPFRHSTIIELNPNDDSNPDVTVIDDDDDEERNATESKTKKSNDKTLPKQTNVSKQTAASAKSSLSTDHSKSDRDKLVQRPVDDKKKVSNIEEISSKSLVTRSFSDNNQDANESGQKNASAIVDLVKNLKSATQERMEVDRKIEAKTMPLLVDPPTQSTSDMQGSIVDFVKNLKPNRPQPKISSESPPKMDVERMQSEPDSSTTAVILGLVKGLKSSPTPVVQPPFQPSLESLTNLLPASHSDENVNVILEILLQNELIQPNPDIQRVALMRGLIQMRAQRKEAQKRLAQVVNLFNAQSADASANAEPTNQVGLAALLSLMTTVPPPAINTPSRGPVDVGYVSRTEVDPAEHPLKMATRFAAVCGMNKAEFEKKLQNFQSFDRRTSQFVFAGKDFAENLDSDSVAEFLQPSPDQKPTDVSSDESVVLKEFSSLDEGGDRRRRSNSSDRQRHFDRYGRKRRRSKSRSPEDRRYESQNVYTDRGRSDSGHSSIVFDQPATSSDVDPSILLYYDDSKQEIDGVRHEFNQEFVENLIVKVDNDDRQSQKLPVKERLGYFSSYRKRKHEEEQKRLSSSSSSLRFTVQNDFYHNY